jgi:transcriptional regulator with GAF, ATPase, and Fis domain
VRELANVVERAVINTRGTVLRLSETFAEPQTGDAAADGKTLEEVERGHIIRVLEGTGWRIEGPGGAARVLGLNPSTLRTRMAKLKVQKKKSVVET